LGTLIPSSAGVAQPVARRIDGDGRRHIDSHKLEASSQPGSVAEHRAKCSSNDAETSNGAQEIL